ncbi:unnamed protein product [Oikopleura dioica]|uniref:non-specific serine/threonine protein kinase n=1 Tax=Oikopleura dioica TaxID=34765 RepID=E4XGE5_OIKDI|nr:unnamed protein product [Oikopleura dioica]
MPDATIPPPSSRLKLLEQLVLCATALDNGDQRIHGFSYETLLDILQLIHNELSVSNIKNERHVSEFIDWSRAFTQKVNELRIRRSDFDLVRVIGRGAFGEVAVVRMKGSKKVYAMKTLSKWDMLQRAEVACYREERDVLVRGDSPWLVKLHYAFQDPRYLYFVMDYYAGGDLLTLISKHDDILEENVARFYAAEMVVAIDALHGMGYVHRDIKPDNVLIDNQGHIKLGDFGSCLRMRRDGTIWSRTSVGTPDYISPEILQANEDGHGRYGKECDWWSFGVCIFEMLFGETPFYAEGLAETYCKIMNHTERFSIPDDEIEVSESTKELIRGLICDKSTRMGQFGIDEFKSHAFFAEIQWDSLLSMRPPYVPEIAGETDTSNFDVDDDDARVEAHPPSLGNATFSGKDLPFVGFSFNNNLVNEKNRDQIKIQHYESHERDLNLKIEYLQQELRSSEHSKNSLSDELHIVQQQQINDQQRIITLQAKFDELSNESAFHRTKGNEVKHLQHELDSINLKLEESAQNHLFEISKTKRDYEEQINELRRKIEEERNEKEQIYRNSTNEFELLQNDHSQTQEKLNEANKELEVLKQELKESQEKLEVNENDKDSEKTEWEDHLRSIIQWVHDEKDARSYLDNLAVRMSDELESIRRAKKENPEQPINIAQETPVQNSKQSPIPSQAQSGEFKENWKTLRQTKVKNAQILDLRSALQTQLQKTSEVEHENTLLRRKLEEVEQDLTQARMRIQDIEQSSYHHVGLTKAAPSQVGKVTDRDLYNIPTRGVPAKQHLFMVRTFSEPTQCQICGTYMTGLWRQGVICSECWLPCHISCAKDAPQLCPGSEDREQTWPHQVGFDMIDLARNQGTIMSGYVSIPKPKGVKKGWQKHFAVITGNRLILFPLKDTKNQEILQVPSVVVDLKDRFLSVEKVIHQDVIHANKRDIPNIFKLSACSINRTVFDSTPFQFNSFLIMCSSGERQKWISAIKKLHDLLIKNRAELVPSLGFFEIYDPNLVLIKNTHCAKVIDRNRVLLGTDDGLYCAELAKDEFVRIADKRVSDIRLCLDVDIIVIISGNRKTVRLFPISAAISGHYDQDPPKLEETRGCYNIATGLYKHGQVALLAVAKPKLVLVYEMFPSTELRTSLPRYRKVKEIPCDVHVQFLEVFLDRVCIGTETGVTLYSLQGAPALPLLNTQNNNHPLYQLLNYRPMELLAVVDLSPVYEEFLVCTSSFGIYISPDGTNRSRQSEIMWTSPPISIRTLRLDDGSEKPQCLIVVYTESTVDIYDGFKGTWMQSINARRVSPLESSSAQLSIHSGDDELKRLCILHFEANSEEIHLPHKIRPNARRNLQKLGKRKFVYKSANAERSKSLRGQIQEGGKVSLISGPSEFRHVTHMGPESGFQMMSTEPTPAASAPNRKTSFISGPSNFKHVYHYGPDDANPRYCFVIESPQIRRFSTQSLQSTERSLLTSRTSLIRSTNSSELSEKSPVQSNSIEKRYARRSGYFPED